MLKEKNEMRDLNKAIERIEQQTWGRETRPASAADKPKPSPRAWRTPDTVLRLAEREAHANTLIARTVKLTVSLQPAAVAALIAPESGPSRIKLNVVYDGGTLRAEVAAKSVRKAQKMIAENGVENVFVALQGRLGRGEIVECGLTVQVKASCAPSKQ
jgi:hypothetical protein